ncbi:hypothetical protein E1B28_006446 [Marasmius oreades]|uniref:FAD-binding PCMH-type domain-containing protein n=1 Tax=Marasmius oreades TaxID=181124 RepID=A0A9P7S7G9_9AGAR|nr:uncharacterized protein E1B28_006446 [Marasmius oreades]KAG7095736.1 hypothetical protein E1B28_006446 [Marasmius oreades]
MLSSFLSQLGSLLSPNAKIVTNETVDEFTELLRRWTDSDKQIPGAIVLVATEEDVVNTVKLAVQSKVPFVPKSGGHSSWSTIGQSGIIIDLSRFRGVVVDKDAKSVTVTGGTVIKEVNDAAFEQGLCVPLGNANSLGVIPMAIGGGLTVLATLCGYASDNILSAHLVTAKGELITVSDTSHPDLLYAIRGAGQFFGVVTTLTLRAYPLSILRTPDSTIYSGKFVFPISRLQEVLDVLVPMVVDESNPWTGYFMVCAPPPTLETVILFFPYYFGPTQEAEKFLEPISALGPIVSTGGNLPYVRVNDITEPFCIKDGFKRLTGAGTGVNFFRENVKDFSSKVVELFEELKKTAPDAAASLYAIEWSTYVSPDKKKFEETAFSHKDVKFWFQFMVWYTEPASHGEVSRFEQQAINTVREGQAPEDISTYQNWTRSAPIEIRYRGESRLKRLRALKKEWDPNGVFTRELL